MSSAPEVSIHANAVPFALRLLTHVFPARSGPPEVGKALPLNRTVSGDDAAFDVIITFAESAPEAVGENVPVKVAELSANTVALAGLTVNAALSLAMLLITKLDPPALYKEPVDVEESPGKTLAKLTIPGSFPTTGFGSTHLCGNKISSTLR